MSHVTGSQDRLAGGSIGLVQVVFQSVASMGPAATLVSSLPLVMAYAGGAAVTAMIFALVILLLVAVSVAQLARRMPSAGSFATWAANGMGPRTGFIIGWLYLLLTLLISPLLVLILSSVMSAATHSENLWWVWALVATAVVVMVNVQGAQASSRLNVILGGIEVAIFAVLSVWLIIKAGSHNTLQVLGTTFATVQGQEGISGIIAGAAYCVLAFSGFEAAAPMAEETRDARRAIPRAVLYSLLAVAGLEILGVYAVTVFYGPANAFTFSQIGGALGQGWENLAQSLLPIGTGIVIFAVLTSCLGNANAGVNASSRTLFALGRAQLLPSALAHINPRWRSPVVAITVQVVVSLVVTLGLGAGYGPAIAFGIVGTSITLLYVLLYMSVHVSCFSYFRRQAATEIRSVVLHYIVPVAGVLLLLPELFVASGIRLFSFISPIPAPFSYGAIAALVWIPIGAIYLAITGKRHPERVSAMATVIEGAAA